MKKLITITISVLMLTMFMLPKSISHAQTTNWDWQSSLNTNPNQYWSTFENHPVIQKTNDQHEITYYINVTNKSPYYRAWNNAINQYNNLNVIKLIPTTNKANAQIVFNGTYNLAKARKMTQHPNLRDLDGNSGTTTTSTMYSGGPNAYYTKTVCTMATHIGIFQKIGLFNVVAEHELGRALGFNNNPNQINNHNVIMEPQFNIDALASHIQPEPLGTYEATQLKIHYLANN